MSRAATALALLLAATAPARAQFCPCYTLSSQYNNGNCGVEAIPGTNPTVAQWNPIFDLICRGPKAWGAAGPPVGQIGQGCGKPNPTTQVDATFPIELLKAIAMAETGWRQFCNPTTPQDQPPNPSRTIISFDCGYGIGQVTSGMHKGENPPYDRMKVAGDPTYNMATGTQILAAKWRATNCVGDNQPKIVEHWYTATWAYNGLAYSNNPNNPNLDANRPVYNPKVGGAYAYQEKVWGWMQHPPTNAHWASIAMAYPNRANLGNTGAPPDIPEPSCAGPTDCVNKRGTHGTACGAMPQPPPDLSMAGGMDAASARDAAAPPTTPDASALDGDTTDAPTPDRDAGDGDDGGTRTIQAGCGCRTGGRAGIGDALPLLAALLLLRRRRS